MALIALETLTFGLKNIYLAAKKQGQELILFTRDNTIYNYELNNNKVADYVKIINLDTLNSKQLLMLPLKFVN